MPNQYNVRWWNYKKNYQGKPNKKWELKRPKIILVTLKLIKKII